VAFIRLPDARKTQVRPNTWAGCRTAVRHLINAFGPRLLATLTPLNLQKLYTHMVAHNSNTQIPCGVARQGVFRIWSGCRLWTWGCLFGVSSFGHDYI